MVAFFMCIITFVNMQLQYSFIIPVFNRPQEIKELLDSFVGLNANLNYEIVIVEDGSTKTCKDITDSFSNKLDINYIFKNNTGPGDSRNTGMKNAKGNYFIILDSDCILPESYLNRVNNALEEEFVDCYGGPDESLPSFSQIQKAINFAMTSFISTGGIRGKKSSVSKFQPRSFNMGLSKDAFLVTNGFSNIHPGEDPDLSIRLLKKGFKTKLIPEATVYHKRRISWKKFLNQVYKFGLVRPILNKWYPETKQIVYWFPTVFSLGLISSLLLVVYGYYFLVVVYGLYFFTVFALSLLKNMSILIAVKSIYAVLIQMFGYGFGFLKSTLVNNLSRKEPEKLFPKLFFIKENE